MTNPLRAETEWLVEWTPIIVGTSTTSRTIAGSGALTFTLEADVVFETGMTVTLDAGSGNAMTATVTGCDADTLTVSVTGGTGSGTHASWTISGTHTFRFSAWGHRTGPAESPATAYYDETLVEPGNYERHLFARGRISGRTEVGFGVVTLDNGDGRYDRFRRYGADGRAIRIRRCRRGAAYAGAATLLTGTTLRVDTDRRQARFILRDRLGEVVGLPMQTARFAGTNVGTTGVEGTADDLIDRPKPMLFGKGLELPVPPANAPAFVFLISTREIAGVDAVYDDGVALAAGTTHATLAALLAATPASGVYDLYLGGSGDGAHVKVGGNPNRVTVDATEGVTAADRTAGRIWEAILTGPGGVDPGDIRSGVVAALDAANDAVIGLWTGTDETTVGEALDLAAGSVGAGWTQRRDGTFEIVRLEAPKPVPDHTVQGWQILDDGTFQIERLDQDGEEAGIPAKAVLLEHTRIYQTFDPSQIAAVAASRQAYLAETYRTSRAEATNAVALRHLLAREVVRTGQLTATADADAESARLVALLQEDREVFSIPVPSDLAEAMELGETIRFDEPRLLLDRKSFVLIGVSEMFSAEVSQLVVWG